MQEHILDSCTLCPRTCRVNRSAGQLGYCRAGADLIAARAALHHWEEPSISGEKGSGTVFFSGCPLGCVYCQNHCIAAAKAGKEITVRRMADIFLELEQQGALNINLVTPTHFVPQIIHSLNLAKADGLRLPVIYNTGGYERVETLRLLEGYVDVYLPDFKYISPSAARLYSNAPDYPDVVKSAIAEMFRQTGKIRFDSDGIARRGMIVRHLVLPGHAEDAKRIIKYLHTAYGEDIYLSIMNQYTPMPAAKSFPNLRRPIRRDEYDSVIDYALSIGVENAYIQEGETAEESFIPEFNLEGL